MKVMNWKALSESLKLKDNRPQQHPESGSQRLFFHHTQQDARARASRDGMERWSLAALYSPAKGNCSSPHYQF